MKIRIAALIFCFAAINTSFALKPTFVCPEKDIVSPCKCLTWEPEENETLTEVEIACRTFETDEKSLAELFVRLDKHIAINNASQQFESLRLESTAIRRVNDKSRFANVAFKQLDFFNNVELTEFELSSFENSKSSLETLCVQGSPLGNNTSLLSDLHRFENLETLIISNSELNGLPEKMFNNVTMTQLSYIELSSNRITELGHRQFAKLPEVHRINLDHNNITYVHNDSFSFDHEESKLLLLFLRNNQLNASSFEPGLLSDLEKTTFLYLNYNNITHLDENIWKTTLELKNDLFIALWNNPYECDCRSKWLLNNIEYYKKRIHGIKCADKRELWDLTFKELNCTDATEFLIEKFKEVF